MCSTSSVPPPSSKPNQTNVFTTQNDTACGFTALFGPSNSGKSTLLNRLIGSKLAIVSPKVQTTRCRIAGITAVDKTQLIFLDTPGIFTPTTRLSRAMVKSAWASYRDADAAILILDALRIYRSSRLGSEAQQLLSRVRKNDFCVAANKIDAVPKDERPKVVKLLRESMDIVGLQDAPIKTISALHGQGVEELLQWVIERMPKGPWLYPEDDFTDMPARLLAAEVTREKLFYALRNELPYEIAVETTSYEDQADGSIRITQDILVRRNSQKRIVTGRSGSVVKSVGIKSRAALAKILGATVHLMLTVKIRQQWKEDKLQYEQWGLDFNA
ncbi:50S ribosome-binding GTPase [Gracilaria domingensis]|nr:50S ribosome-binding GTPase [Gracilaria domingensis]